MSFRPLFIQFACAVSVIVLQACTPFGAAPDPSVLQTQARQSIYRDEHFYNQGNPAIYTASFWKVMRKFFFGPTGRREPAAELPVQFMNAARWQAAPPEELRITWLGHASVLIELHGYRLLTDPVFSKRASPFQWLGPARFHPLPLDVDELPMLDAIILSHDHYDHLDYDTMLQLAPKTKKIIVPLGVAAHLVSWGIDRDKIIERDWWQETRLNSHIQLIATPAQHFSGRGFFDRNKTLWASWVILTPEIRIYFSGDSGMFDGFTQIGERFGPFDVTLMHVGAYAKEWHPVHMNPEEAVSAHQTLRGDLFVPIHWGTFNLAFHDWNEPAERLYKSATNQHLRFVIPQAGQTINPAQLPPLQTWWRALD